MALDIPHYRLHNQFLSQTNFTEPAQVVAALGAVQSQDYAGGKWALAQRLKTDSTDAAIDQAFNEGRILRTHVMRPTWHFVTPDDLRWMLALSAPRVHTMNGFMYRQQGLDRAVIKQSYAVLENILQGGRYLTRPEIGAAFEQSGIKNADSIRLGYFLMSAELDAIICSGPRRGKQFTYALFEERASKATLTREEALLELTRRYFATRGPATLHDFIWWSGLTMAQAKEGIESLRKMFVSVEIGRMTYWFDESVSPVEDKAPAVHLLPNYDEYFIGFKDRSAIGKTAQMAGIKANDPSFLAHVIILDGQVIGGWKRNLKKDKLSLECTPIIKLTKAQKAALDLAASQYAEFLELPWEWI